MAYTKEQLEAMSDLQLNRIIAFNIRRMEKCKETTTEQNKGLFNESPIGKKAVVKTLNDNIMFFDYCNDPSDMMPLVFESLISIEWDADLESDTPVKWCNVYLFDRICLMHQTNPLRACAIVYILINQ